MHSLLCFVIISLELSKLLVISKNAFLLLGFKKKHYCTKLIHTSTLDKKILSSHCQLSLKIIYLINKLTIKKHIRNIATTFVQKLVLFANFIRLLAIMMHISNPFIHLFCLVLSTVFLFGALHLKLLYCTHNKIYFILPDIFILTLKNVQK